MKQQDLGSLSLSLGQTADNVCLEILGFLNETFSSRVNLIALGKWGSFELGLRSDLDFIFAIESNITANDHKVAKRFISSLTSSIKGGPLYSVDLRLRPSGNAGPLLVNIKNLQQYLKIESAVWERQSYLRARPLFESDIDLPNICTQRGLGNDDVVELRNIRKKIFASQGKSKDTIDIKRCPGGLLDIELCLQTLMLKNRCRVIRGSTISFADQLVKQISELKTPLLQLSKYFTYFRKLEQNYQLKSSYSTSDLKTNSDAFLTLSNNEDASPDEYSMHIQSELSKASEIIKTLDPIYAQT